MKPDLFLLQAEVHEAHGEYQHAAALYGMGMMFARNDAERALFKEKLRAAGDAAEQVAYLEQLFQRSAS